MISVSPPSAAKCNVFHPLLSSQFTVAPFSRNHFTACNLPPRAAIIKGVRPWLVFDSMFSKWVWIRSMMSVSPPSAAKCNAFAPLLSSRVTVAPFSRNHFTACNLLLKAAIISGVQPSPVFDSMLGTCVWIRSMISASPPFAATCNEFHPLLSIRDGSAPLSIKLFTTWTLPL